MLMLGLRGVSIRFVAIPPGALQRAGLIAVPVSFVAFRLSGGYRDRRRSASWLSFANVGGRRLGNLLTALRGIDKATRESTTYWMALACVVAAIAGLPVPAQQARAGAAGDPRQRGRAESQVPWRA